MSEVKQVKVEYTRTADNKACKGTLWQDGKKFAVGHHLQKVAPDNATWQTKEECLSALSALPVPTRTPKADKAEKAVKVSVVSVKSIKEWILTANAEDIATVSTLCKNAADLRRIEALKKLADMTVANGFDAAPILKQIEGIKTAMAIV